MNTLGIIIPSYQQKSFLCYAIESALDQTVKAPIVVVDDGSTDGSVDIAKSYESQGVRVISQVNKGLSSARNTGLMNLTTDYVLPLDADDILMENCVERILQTTEQTQADIVAPSFKCFGVINEVVILDSNLTTESFVTANRIGYFSAYRRDKAIAIGGYSPRMVWGYEDLHFWVDLLKRGATIVTIPEPLVLYRTKFNSMITVAQAHHDELMAQIYKDHPQVIPK